MKRLAINANGNTITSFARELKPTGVEKYFSLSLSIYIYIYISPSSSWKATYLPSHYLSQQNEQETLGTAGEITVNSLATFYKILRHMHEPELAEQQGHQFSVDNGCSREVLPGEIDDKDGWCERIKEDRAISMC